MASATPHMNIPTMPQAIIRTGRDTGGCSMLGAKFEGAVEAMVAELVGGVGGVFIVEELVLVVLLLGNLN